jgi:hypothetical protein
MLLYGVAIDDGAIVLADSIAQRLRSPCLDQNSQLEFLIPQSRSNI